MDKKKKEAIAAFMLLAPCAIGFFVFYILPFLISVYYSFTKGVGNVEYVGFQNFIDLFGSSSFQLAAKNTGLFMIIAVPLIMIVSLLIATVLNSKMKNMGFFRTIAILPLVIPVASVVLVWTLFFQEQGVLNGILTRFFDIEPIDWIRSEYGFYIMILLYVWKNSAYNIIIFLVGLNAIPKSLYEAASIDGSSKFRSFRKITLPLLSGTTFFVFIISIINSFKVYREAYLLAGDYPAKNMYMLQHFMNNNFKNLNYQRLSTAAIILLILIIMLVYILLRYQRKNEVEY